jgi:hypothetical protein
LARFGLIEIGVHRNPPSYPNSNEAGPTQFHTQSSWTTVSRSADLLGSLYSALQRSEARYRGALWLRLKASNQSMEIVISAEIPHCTLAHANINERCLRVGSRNLNFPLDTSSVVTEADVESKVCFASAHEHELPSDSNRFDKGES